jgi:hypothetical protein
MLRILKLSVVRRILSIISAQRDYYKHNQDRLVIGSIEWKYYQSKLNALTDLEDAIIEEFNLKN